MSSIVQKCRIFLRVIAVLEAVPKNMGACRAVRPTLIHTLAIGALCIFFSASASAEQIPVSNGDWWHEKAQDCHDEDGEGTIRIDNDRVIFYESTCHASDVIVDTGGNIELHCDMTGEGGVSESVIRLKMISPTKFSMEGDDPSDNVIYQKCE